MRIGITGQTGFIGTHLYNLLGTRQDIVRIPFEDSVFQSENDLRSFVKSCDVIVHFAALNRHNDPDVIYRTNLELVNKLIEACEYTSSTPHILFSSSTQEERDNPYGRSKREGRKLFEAWAERNKATFTGLVIPNVFGPFGHPYYNSVVATFCHQITHNEIPKIDVDGDLKLIYVGELASTILELIERKANSTASGAAIETCKVPHTGEIKVSGLLSLLLKFKNDYFQKGEIPDISTSFHRNLFNTFIGYIDHTAFFPFSLKLNTDNRGTFVEIIKLVSGGQVSFSTTKPGITRGEHFHTRKAERFAVISGKARIQLRRIGTTEVLNFDLDGTAPSFVDMPVWYTHNITNTGSEDLYTLFWINEPYNPDDPDTYFEKVNL